MTVSPVTLRDLESRGLGRIVRGDGDVRLIGVRHDSREVEPEELFVAVPGFSTDGARFCGDAVARGAAALAVEAPLDLDVPQLQVDDARRALAPLASIVYGEPTRALDVIGLTGTNGKTTTTWLIDEALTALGKRPSLLGTIETRGPHGREPAGFTTPEADAIARFARRAVDAGGTHMVMEVSSHALAMHRADGVLFDVAAFTNLSQDHLDFHDSMEAYFDAKARLFTDLAPAHAVLNIDDPAGVRLLGLLGAETRCTRVSRRADADADLKAVDAMFSRDGFEATIQLGARSAVLRSPMLGEHNLDNHLLAAGCLLALDLDLEDVVDALAEAVGAPGRLERVTGLRDVAILVDYAHTPDAIEHALSTLRHITPGRLLIVFGCGGDRDKKKRPVMGRVAAEGADLVFVTSDNPRTEDPLEIIAAIEPAVRERQDPLADDALGSAERGYVVIEDRRRAIEAAVRCARPSDTILVAGKGHEDYQIRGTEKLSFDDRVEVRRAIGARAGG